MMVKKQYFVYLFTFIHKFYHYTRSLLMQAKENQSQAQSPYVKKRVRICSINSDKKKVLTETTLNAPETAPFQQPYSPHLKKIKRKNTVKTSGQQNIEDLYSQGVIKLKSKKAESENIRIGNWQNTEFEKLMEITTRCVDYYNKFTQVKNSQLIVVSEAFKQIHEKLNNAFNGIITQVMKKHQQIKQFLQKKEKELIKIKQDQERQLNNKLSEIRSVHLSNLLSDNQIEDSQFDLNNQICNYAGTLHQFYETMELVERENFKDLVQETINFINNIITEEIKFTIYDKIPNKSLNGSFSFNDGFGFANSINNTILNIPNAMISPKMSVQINDGSMATENLQISIGQRGRTRQVNDGWTQTMPQIFGIKQSMLEVLTNITKNQQVLKGRIAKYREEKV